MMPFFSRVGMNGSQFITMVISDGLEMNVPVLEGREGVVVVAPGLLLPGLTGGPGGRRHQDAGRRLGLRLAAAELRLLQVELASLEVRQSSPGSHVGAAHPWPALQ